MDIKGQLLEADRIIAYRPEVARQVGSIEAAILYQQLYFWSNKGKRDDGFIYKSRRDIEEETYLTSMQQRLACNKLRAKGWIETKKLRADGAPTLHYKCLVDIKTLIMPVDKPGSDLLKQQNDLLPATNQIVKKQQIMNKRRPRKDTRDGKGFKKAGDNAPDTRQRYRKPSELLKPGEPPKPKRDQSALLKELRERYPDEFRESADTP